MTHPFLTSGRPDLLAHRGASHSTPPGNTIAAFEAALDAGCDHLETDVQLTKDGVVVIFHDERLDHLTTGSGSVHEWTWAELQTVRYVVDGEPVEHGLVLLERALQVFPTAYFNIDVKTDDAVDPTVALLRRRASPDRVCIAALSRRRLQRLRRGLGVEWCSAFARNEIAIARIAAWLRLPIPTFGNAVQAPERFKHVRVVDERFVLACHRRGLAVHVWTVNDPDAADRLRSLGVDALISDRPERFGPDRPSQLRTPTTDHRR